MVCCLGREGEFEGKFEPLTSQGERSLKQILLKSEHVSRLFVTRCAITVAAGRLRYELASQIQSDAVNLLLGSRHDISECAFDNITRGKGIARRRLVELYAEIAHDVDVKMSVRVDRN